LGKLEKKKEKKKEKTKNNENIHIFSSCPPLPSKEMTKLCVGVALNGNSAKCPMAMVALLGKLTLKKKKKKPTQSIKFH
jgi:hypothetical protein